MPSTRLTSNHRTVLSNLVSQIVDCPADDARANRKRASRNTLNNS